MRCGTRTTAPWRGLELEAVVCRDKAYGRSFEHQHLATWVKLRSPSSPPGTVHAEGAKIARNDGVAVVGGAPAFDRATNVQALGTPVPVPLEGRLVFLGVQEPRDLLDGGAGGWVPAHLSVHRRGGVDRDDAEVGGVDRLKVSTALDAHEEGVALEIHTLDPPDGAPSRVAVDGDITAHHGSCREPPQVLFHHSVEEALWVFSWVPRGVDCPDDGERHESAGLGSKGSRVRGVARRRCEPAGFVGGLVEAHGDGSQPHE
mmetsp:Transcript_30151/g.87824  ORF Transcript_30151/g.87824 Transcript_30151/m.87824 type:complete len:259 (-) Transcript_30151:1159-1935(-)